MFRLRCQPCAKMLGDMQRIPETGLGRLGAEARLAEADALLARDGGSSELGARARVAGALVDRGDALVDLDRLDAALASYRQVVAEFSDVDDDGITERVAAALRKVAGTLQRSGCYEAVAAASDELLARFGNAADLQVREHVAAGLGSKAVALATGRRYAEALAAADEMLGYLDASPRLDRPSLVAYGLQAKALALQKLGRTQEIADLVPRFGGLVEPVADGPAEANVRVLSCQVRVLRMLDRDEEALACCEELVSQSDGPFDRDVEFLVCDAMLCAARWKAKFRGIDEALEVIDRAVARFGDTTDPRLRDRVLGTLSLRAATLLKAGRHEEAIAAADSFIDRLGMHPRPPWLAQACRTRFAKATCLRVLGRSAEALGVYSDVVELFGSDEHPDVQVTVADALRQRAQVLVELGRSSEAIETLKELAARFGAATEPGIRSVVADGLCVEGDLLAKSEREVEGVAAYDDALAMLAMASERALREKRVDVLDRKGMLMSRLDRDAEAIVIADSTLAAYRDLASEYGHIPKMLSRVIERAYFNIHSLCALQRADEAGYVSARVAAALGDTVALLPASLSQAPLPEADVAELLAKVHSSDCWLQFGLGAHDSLQRHERLEQALGLYRRTDPWLAAAVRDENEHALVAVMAIRTIAGGYAVLASKWGQSKSSDLPLPNRQMFEWGLRRTGVTDWAAELGHPVKLEESVEAAEEWLDHQRSGQDGELSDEQAQAFATTTAASLYQFDLLAAVWKSPNGREALRSGNLSDIACWMLTNARTWAARIGVQDEEASGVAVLNILIAEAYVAATQSDLQASNPLFPDRETLAWALQASEAGRWLDHHAVEIPAWLTDSDN